MHYLLLEESQRFEVPKGLAPFRCVILLERAVDAANRELICKQLVEAGCRWALTWGIDCLAWHDSIDDANFDRFIPGSIPDDQYVITTWHEDETIEDVLFFAKFNALWSTADLDLVDLLILDVGTVGRKEEIREAYERA